MASTPADAWEKIQRGGMLKCFNRLKAEHAAGEEEPIGAKLGDPPHFGDYIMFGGGMGGEKCKCFFRFFTTISF